MIDSIGFDSKRKSVMYVPPNLVLHIASSITFWLVVARDSWGGVTLFRETGPSIQLQSVEIKAGRYYEAAYLLTDIADHLLLEEV